MARWYYYPEDATGALARLRDRLFRKPVPDFPRTVVIETQFGCNAACVFCSYTQLRDRLPHGKMPAATFAKIALECAGRGVERFILCFDNEPLLDPTLGSKFAILRQLCPESVRNLTTNGSLLTFERVEALIGSGDVNELFLSVNGYSREVYEELMKLPYARTMANLEALCEWLRAHPQVRRRLRVRVNVVSTRRVAPELPLLQQRWAGQEGFELHVIGMDNRGGETDLERVPVLAADRRDMRPNLTCRRLFHTLVLTWEGDAVLCCADYRRQVKLGNVERQTVHEIWNGPVATGLRKEYLRRDLTHLAICRTCRVNA